MVVPTDGIGGHVVTPHLEALRGGACVSEEKVCKMGKRLSCASVQKGRLAGHNREHPYLSRPNLGIRQEEGGPEFTTEEVGRP